MGARRSDRRAPDKERSEVRARCLSDRHPTSQQPMAKNRLRVIPLGGSGEVGRNMWVLEYGEEIVLLDCGVMFPEAEMLGRSAGRRHPRAKISNPSADSS